MVKKLLYTWLVAGCMLTLAIMITQPVAQGQESNTESERLPISIDNIDQMTLLGGSLVSTTNRYTRLMSFNDDGDYLLNVPNTQHLFNVSSLEAWPLPANTAETFLSPDGKSAIFAHRRNNYGSGPMTLRLWHFGNSPRDMIEMAVLGETNNRSTRAVFSPDNQWVAVPDNDGISRIQLYDVATGANRTIISDSFTAGGSTNTTYNTVRFSPNSTILAVTDYRTLRLWDVASQDRLALLETAQNNRDQTDFVFNADSSLIAYRGASYNIHVYDIQSGEERFIAALPDTQLRSLYFDFSTDGTALVIDGDWGRQNFAQVWDVESGNRLNNFVTPQDGTILMAATPQRIAVWDTSANTLVIRDTAPFQQRPAIQIEDIQFDRTIDSTFTISPNGNVIAISDHDGIWTYDARTERSATIQFAPPPPPTPFQQGTYAKSFAFSADERLIISADTRNALIQFWDVETGQEIRRLSGYYFALSPDGTTLEVSVSDTSAALVLYGIPEGRAIYPAIPGNIPSEGINLRTAPSSDAPRIDVISGEILVAARSDDGSHVYVANHNGWVRYGPSYIQLALDLPLDWLPILNSPPHWTVAFDPPPPTILPSVATPTATIFSTRTPLPTLAATLPPATSPPPTEIAAAQPEPNGDLRVINTTNIDDVRLVGVIGGDKFAFTPDGSMMVVNKGVQLELWDTATLTRITATGAGDAMQMMPDGRGVLTWDNVRSGRNRRLWYWDIRNPESPQLTMLTEQNRAFAISPDSTTLTFDIFNDNSQTVLWDVQTNTERFSITDPYRLLKYSPDGTRLFLGWAFQRNNADPLLNIEAIHLIDVEAGRQLAVYHRDDVISTDIYFSPDNSLFATGGVNVLISDMATGESHMTIPTRAQIIAFTPDNQVALTFSPSTGLLHTWDISGTAAVEIGDLRDTVSAFHLSDDGTVLVTVHSGELGTQFWDVPSGTRLASFGYFGMDQIAISPDNRFAVFTSGAYVALADILNETWLATPSGLPSNITNLNFSPDSLYLELTLADNSRRLLDIRTSDQFSPISQDFSGRSIFATTSTLGFWLAYNRPDGRYIELTPRYPNADLHFDSRLSEIAFSSDGSTLAVTSADNNARPSLIMIFGVPTPNRPQWQAVEGTIYPEGIDVHTEPRRYSRSIRVLLQGETVQIGGQFENYYYLPDLGGWIRAESFYVTLDDEQRSLIPPLIQVRR